MQLEVTHYVRRSPEPDEWLPLAFVTRSVDAPHGPMFFGFEVMRPLSREDVQSREDAKALKRLDWPCRIEPHQCLWLSPDGDVWIASTENPLSDKHKTLIERSGSRVSHCGGAVPEIALDSSVVAAINRTAKMRCLLGRYANSLRSDAAYFPHWQRTLRLATLKRVREILGMRDITVEELQPQAERYSYVTNAIVNQNVALPLEFMFHTEARRPVLALTAHIANVVDLALVYRRGSNVEYELNLRDEERYTDTYEDWIARLKEAGVHICVPTQTAPEDLLESAVLFDKLHETKLFEASTSPQLLEWLSRDEHRGRGLLAVDVGIACQLRRYERTLALGVSYVPYDEAIPVGIASKRGDELWARELEGLVLETLRSGDERVAESFAETRKLLTDLHMEWTADSLSR